jgi:hypothetical protein
MLLDEPFGALDPITRDSLRTEFRRIQQELGLAAVLVTHDMVEALLLGDSIIVMRDGHIVGRGTPAELLRDPGDPYIAQLMESPTNQAARLTIGGDPEFFGRLEWTRVREAYGLGAMRTRGMDSTFMCGAVRDGGVDVITAYSTDGRIAAFDLVVLDDPEQAFPPYDAVILLSPRAAGNPRLIETLLPLINAVPDDAMRWANKLVDTDGLTPEEAARRLLGRIVSR